jgi:hypothetical protein
LSYFGHLLYPPFLLIRFLVIFRTSQEEHPALFANPLDFRFVGSDALKKRRDKLALAAFHSSIKQKFIAAVSRIVK